MPKLTYYQHSITETVNHGIESLVSLSVAALFGATSIALFRYLPNPQTASLCYSLNYISGKFLKDSMIEFFTAIGHIPYISSPGKIIDLYYNNTDIDPSTSIGKQESYNQAVEGVNKAAIISAAQIILGPKANALHLNGQQELLNSHLRSFGYSIYDKSSTKQHYEQSGHFLQEYELHHTIEAPIWGGFLFISIETFGNSHPLSQFFLEEFTIEFTKGAAFHITNDLCPSCSETKEELVANLMEYFSD